MHRTIMAATDGSEAAVKAVGIATDLAIRNDAELLIAHVVSDADASSEAMEMAETEGLVQKPAEEPTLIPGHPLASRVPFAGFRGEAGSRAEAARGIGQRLVDEAARVAGEAGAKRVRRIVEFGDDPARTLLDLVKREAADVVVVGTRGRGRIGELLLGSVAHKLVSSCECTCVIVR